MVLPDGVSKIRWLITLSLSWFSPVEFQRSDESLPSPYPGSPLWNFKDQMDHYSLLTLWNFKDQMPPYPLLTLWNFKDQMAHCPLLTLVLPCRISKIRWLITLSLPCGISKIRWLLTLSLTCGISKIRWLIALSLPWYSPVGFQRSDGSLPSPYHGSPRWSFKDQMAHYPLLTMVLPCGISKIRWLITLSSPFFSPVEFQRSDGSLPSPYHGSPLWNFKDQMAHYPLLTMVLPCGISKIRWLITLSLPWFSPVGFQYF